MCSSFVRACSLFTERFISPSNLGSYLPHSRGCTRNNISSLFTKAITTSTTVHSDQKNRSWVYLAAGIFIVVCLQQVYMSLKNKASSEDDEKLEESPRPISFISSDTYKAACFHPIPPRIVQKMMGKSYKETCPIPITDLTYVKITHYNMKGKICSGELVVHKKIAGMVMEIFKDIYAAKFPIEKIRLIDEYKADDDLSMEDNNSSAFCFRSITGKPEIISNHGLGIAIDINTRLNPYVKGDIVAPSNARKYVDRSLNEPGMIHTDDAVVMAFKRRGFTWGGDWRQLKDYQHFEIDRARLGLVV